MTILKPYDHSNPIDSLSRFVFNSLLEEGIACENHGEFIKVEVDSLHTDLFEVPSPGTYLLQFSRTPISEQKQSLFGNYQIIHLTNNHPFIKKLTDELQYSAIQNAEYKNENEPKIDFEDWFSKSLSNTELTTNINTVKDNKDLKLAEFWFELVSKSGRGMFPIILEKIHNSLDGWRWSEYFQKTHVNFRGLLTSINHLESFIEFNQDSSNEQKLSKNFIEDLNKGIDISKKKINEVFNENVLNDGAFLRRLRQLRQAQMRLALAKDRNESKSMISHLERTTQSIIDEIESQKDISLNTIVLLFSTYEIEKKISIVKKETNKLLLEARIYWNSDNKDRLFVDYGILGILVVIDLIKGKPQKSLPELQVCPGCQGLTFKSDIKSIDIGNGKDCNICRVVCNVCKKSIDGNNTIIDSHDNLSSSLCLTHAKECEVDRIKTSVNSLILLENQKRVHYVHCAKCYSCDLEKEKYIFYLKEDLSKHSFDENLLLCKKHAFSCEYSGKIVNINEIEKLHSGLYVYREYTGRCDECYACKEQYYLHLKKDLKEHSFRQNYYLCPEHTSICEITGNFVTPSEIVELDTNQKVAIQITTECDECKSNNDQYVYYLSETVKKHSFENKMLCNKHAFTCELTNSIVLEKELQEISDGRKVLKNLTGICNNCSEIPNKIKFHLKTELFTNHLGILTDISSCEEHSFHCCFCDEKRPLLGSIEPTNNLSRICVFCFNTLKNEEMNEFNTCSLCDNLFNIDNIDIYDKKLFKSSCPRCNKKNRLKKTQILSLEEFNTKKLPLIQVNVKKLNIYKSLARPELFLITFKKFFWSKTTWWIVNNSYDLIWTNDIKGIYDSNLKLE